MIWTPPGYLTLDEMFSRVGLEIFRSKWTGREALAGYVQPPEYWRGFELSRKAQGIERKAHSERARRAAVSVSGAPMTRNTPDSSARSNPRPTTAPEIPDWRSETYDLEYLNDQEAKQRFLHVAKRIVDASWHGEYAVFLHQETGEFLPINKTTLQSDLFQQMIINPAQPGRERLLFKPRGNTAAHAEAESASQRADHTSIETPERPRQLSQDEVAANPPQSRKREQRRQSKAATWFQLALKYGYTENRTKRTREGIAKKIANDDEAKDPHTQKIPAWTSVTRRLNEFHPGWAEKSWAKKPGNKICQ
jgi:hypothetical protein